MSTTTLGRPNEPLTKERITAMLAGKRKRGGHLNTAKTFANSGEVTLDVTTLPMYASKTPEQLKNLANQSFKTAIKQLKETDPNSPNIEVYTDEREDGTTALWLINMDLYELMEDED